MAIPGGVLHNPRWQAFDSSGDPLAGALLYSYATGTVTPLALYTNATLTVAHANPVVADANGRFAAMFFQPLNYDLELKTSAGVSVWTFTNISDRGQTFLATLGDELASGNKNQATGYTVLSTDNFVSLSTGSNPAVVNLPAASSRGLPLFIQNKIEGVTLRITPNGADTINSLAGFYTLPAAASPEFPVALLLPNGSSDWLMVPCMRS